MAPQTAATVAYARPRYSPFSVEILIFSPSLMKSGTVTDLPVSSTAPIAMIGQKVAAPSGFTLEMDGNHHLHKPVMIGEVRADGQFNVVWRTKTTIRAQPWSPYIAGNAGKPDAPAKR